jgi:hypothetical protein
MSVCGISAYANWWQGQSQAATGSNATTTSSASDSTTNGGSAAATSVSSFMQAFSADLLAMFGQSASASGSSAAAASATDTGATASSTGQTTSNETSNSVHHHHHAHGQRESGSMNSAANQLVDEIDQTIQNGSLDVGQITQSASAFASDVMRALQSYGSTASTNAATSIVA